MRMVRHIMLVQINQNLELLMKLVNASPRGCVIKVVSSSGGYYCYHHRRQMA